MKDIADAPGFVVNQDEEWVEALSNIETRNSYAVLSFTGKHLYDATEVGGSWFARVLLRAHRPFTILVRSLDGRPVLRIERPFTFFFHSVRVYDARDRLMGSVRREFALLDRIYTLRNRAGRKVCSLHGPIMHPWTFEMRRGGDVLGKITKEWTGLLTETLTDADNFGVQFHTDWPAETKATFLGAVFLIDFAHFENKSGEKAGGFPIGI